MWARRFGLTLLVVLVVSWSAHAQSGQSTGSLQGASEPESLSMSYLNADGTINWQKLDESSQELSKTVSEAAASQDELLSKLEALQTQYTLLLNTSKQADKTAAQVIKSRSLITAVWRTIALAAIGGLVGFTMDRSDIAGVTVGAGFGIISGVVWLWAKPN